MFAKNSLYIKIQNNRKTVFFISTVTSTWLTVIWRLLGWRFLATRWISKLLNVKIQNHWKELIRTSKTTIFQHFNWIDVTWLRFVGRQKINRKMYSIVRIYNGTLSTNQYKNRVKSFAYFFMIFFVKKERIFYHHSQYNFRLSVFRWTEEFIAFDCIKPSNT